MGESAGTQHRVIQRVERTEAHCEVNESPRLERSSGERFGPGARVNPLRIVWADGRRALQPGQTALQFPLEPERAPHGEIDEGVNRIEFDTARREAPRQRDFA